MDMRFVHSQIWMRLQSLIGPIICRGHGIIISDSTSCEVFESMQSIALRAQADVESETAGRSMGATLEHFAKIW